MVDVRIQDRPAAVAAKSLWPTSKWWVATVTAVGSVVMLWLNAGMHVDTAVGIAVVGTVVQAVTSYLQPNHDTPGGVPPAQ